MQEALIGRPLGSSDRAFPWSNSLCNHHEGWGPTSDNRLDLTPCFEYSLFFVIIPAAFIIGAVLRIHYFRTHRKPHGLGRTAWIYWPSQLCMTLPGVMLVLDAMQECLVQSRPKDHTMLLIEVLGYIFMGIAWFSMTVLNHFEHLYSIRASDLILSFYTLAIPATLFIVRTTHNLGDNTATLTLIVALALWSIGFAFESWPRGSTRVQQEASNISSINPFGANLYDKANLFSRLCFHHLQPLMALGTSRTLTKDDIQNQIPERHFSRHAYSRVGTMWEPRVRQWRAVAGTPSHNTKKRLPPSLFSAILRAHMGPLMVALLCRFVLPILLFIPPALLGILLDYLQDAKESGNDSNPDSSSPLWFGVALAIGIFVATVLYALLHALNMKQMSETGTEIKSALTAIIYRKALKLSPGARRSGGAGANSQESVEIDATASSSTGEITNHMSVDAELWVSGMERLTSGISTVLEIIICMFMLYRLLGWSFMAGVLTMLSMTPLQAWRGSVFEGMSEERLRAMDERIRLTTEMLSSIKTIKLHNWQRAFRDKILDARRVELDVMRRIGALYALFSILFGSSFIIISLVTFAVYATWGGAGGTPGELTPKVVFVGITLFGMLNGPFGQVSRAITSVISLAVATRRIQRFLLLEEIDETHVVREPFVARESAASDVSMVVIKDGFFSWTRSSINDTVPDQEELSHDESTPLLRSVDGEAHQTSAQSWRATLRNINLKIHHGSLTAIVGRVGQGKSSLLNALVGETYLLQGSVKIIGRVAYVPQQAWILNESLRANILFGHPYDPKRYRQIIVACGLEPDLAMLPAGDLTEIGDKGINLSGGQKQRVSLARATYDDADIYLLDDPLSAVDAHVDRHLWQHLLGPQGLLSSKTRVLVTHGIHHLKDMDQIVLLRDGEIAENGPYPDLMAEKKVLYQLVKEYSIEEKRVHNNDQREIKGGDGSVSSVSWNTPGSSGDSINRPEIVDQIAVSDSVSALDILDDESYGGPINNETIGSLSKSALEPEGQSKAGQLVEDEDIVSGAVEWRHVKTYLKAVSYKYTLLFLFFQVMAELCIIGTSLWLKRWVSVDSEELSRSLRLFIGVYALITAVFAILCVCDKGVAYVFGRIRASEILHRRLLEAVLRLPLSFFDVTPLGRIMNRFASDMNSVDDRLPDRFVDGASVAVAVGGTCTVIIFSSPVVLLALPVLVAAFLVIQEWFALASRSLKRLYSVAMSPVYQHFDESLHGLSTIRAMRIQERCILESARRADELANAYMAYCYCNRWVEIRLSFLSAVVILIVTLSAVVNRHTLDSGMVGLSLSYALFLTHGMVHLVLEYCEWQNQMVAVERVQEYTDKLTEAPAQLASDVSLPPQWPSEGRVVFRNYSTRYREGLDLVIKNVSFEARPGEHIGVVGRTGAGKSSLTLAMFRAIEAAGSRWNKVSRDGAQQEAGDLGSMDRGDAMDGGRIEIDGVDISTVGLDILREHLAIIPQDPTLFQGTVRENLDPLLEFEDAELWQSLERAHLKDYIRSRADGLQFQVAQNGDNFSAGQRSLICLARALLRSLPPSRTTGLRTGSKCKILILDEATAAVDMETDELIQRTIRKEFSHVTTLTIAHRIKTVMDSDRILVMDQGQVVEFDSPKVLLRNPESLFHKLAKQAGEV